MPPQAPAQSRDVTPGEFARQLGGVVTATSKPSTTPTLDQDVTPEDFAASLGGQVVKPPSDAGIVVSDRPWDQFWRSMYAVIPDVTAMLGGAGGLVIGLPAGPKGAAIGAMAGSGTGGAVGRGIQGGIDVLFDRPTELQNPRSVGEEASRQMIFEGAGRAFSGLVGRFRGRLSPKIAETAERLATNEQYGLRLSLGEITNEPAVRRVEYLAQRGISGYAAQKAAQTRTDAAAHKAVDSILSTLGPTGTSTGAGAAVQDVVTDAASRAGRRIEGAVATNLAPKTGMGATGEMAEAGVQAGRTAFARQGQILGEIIRDSPDVDMGPIHKEALRIFNEEIMPKLVENPSLGPKTAEWQNVVRLYQQAAKSGSRIELSAATQKTLSDAALEKATYAPLRVIGQVLATPVQMSFPSAVALRGTLRDAGKGTDLLAGSYAEGLATRFDAGDRLSGFGGIRQLLNETNPVYQAAAEAYATNRHLFESTLIEKVAQSNPESVLATLTTAEGKFNASRIRQMARVLQDLPKTFGSDEEITAGKKAWDTLRAEWFRRDVMQDNVFGLADRMRKIDPDVLQAWFPDLAGKNVVKQAEVTGKAFESQLLGQLAEADPAKIVDMIGASPARVKEFITRINALPGPVQKGPLVDRVRRSWVEVNLASGDPSKLADRIARIDTDLLQEWFQTPTDQQALDRLTRIGNALATRRQVHGMGAYESLGAVTVVGNLLRGNLGGALTTAIGFEGIPTFLSWAMYNPSVHKYMFDAAATSATVTSKTAALLHAVGAYRSATQASGASQ